jgi:alpha,alpha-trehalase
MTRRLVSSKYSDILKGKAPGKRARAPLSFFLDFDGTLTPIAGHPDDAILLESMREILVALNRRFPIAIISGRGLADLKEKVNVAGLTYVANHGMEISSDGFSFVYDIGALETDALGAVAGKLATLSASHDGTVLEVKGPTLSIHYRLLDSTRKSSFLKLVASVLRPYDTGGLIRITSGKEVVEVRPTANWDKGSAVEWLMERRRFAGTVPFCMGDDETDEDAFRVIKGIGLSLCVGRRKSGADFYLEDQSEVEALLAFLANS